MTVLDNIMAAPIYVKGMKREEIQPIAEDLLSKVGLLNKKTCIPAVFPAVRSSVSLSRGRSR